MDKVLTTFKTLGDLEQLAYEQGNLLLRRAVRDAENAAMAEIISKDMQLETSHFEDVMRIVHHELKER